MVDFPSEEGLLRSQDGGEAILGSSVGFNRILLLLKSLAQTDRQPRWSCYLINLFSVFRNVYASQSQTDRQLHDAVLNDLELFILYLETYLSHLPLNIPVNVPVVVYAPDYHKIPPALLREKSVKALDLHKRYQDLQRTFLRNHGLTSRSEYSTRWIVSVGKHTLPHYELTKWIQEHALSSSTIYRWGEPVFLFTHCPIDLHIHKRVPNVTLVESYTAAIKTPLQFGSKLISDVAIPFTTATHRAFGDSVHLAAIAKNKVRKELISQATKHSWMLLSDERVIQDICTTTHTTVQELSRLKL